MTKDEAALTLGGGLYFQMTKLAWVGHVLLYLDDIWWSEFIVKIWCIIEASGTLDTFYYIQMTCDDPNLSLKYDDDIEFIIYIYIYVPFKI